MVKYSRKETNYNLAARKYTRTESEFPESIPATPEEWENRIIAKTYKAVEERIDNGTASSAEYVHFLRAGSVKQREEMEKLREENALLRAKTSLIESEKDRSVFYKEVIEALTSYRTETTEIPFDPVVY